MEAIGPVLILLAIPLAFRWVPRNRLYGFRMCATLKHDAIWYEVNARSARHLLIVGATMVALELVLPVGVRNQVLSSVAIIGLGVIIVINWRVADRLARQMNL